MTLNGDDVMEASLLRPVEEESGPSPTLEEDITLLGEEMGSQKSQTLLPDKQRSPGLWNLWNGLPLPSPPVLPTITLP